MSHREQASEIEDAAIAWAAKAERGLTVEEQDELDRWFEGDTRRLGAFVQAQAAWIHAERAAALGKMPEPWDGTPDDSDDTSEHPSRTLSRRTVLGGSGALAASIAAAYVFGLDRYRTLESGVGEIRHIALAGGTNLVLDTDSRVDIARSSQDRKLELIRGKMFLDVMQRHESPLSVSAGNLMLQIATGAFGLQSLEDSPIMALVTEGTLFVSQSQGLFGQRQALTIGKDHILTLASQGQLLPRLVTPMATNQQSQFLSWRDGMLSFGGELLGEAVRSFDRYSAARIVVADHSLARQKVVGIFKATDPKGFAEAVAASFGGVVTTDGDVIRISTKKVQSA